MAFSLKKYDIPDEIKKEIMEMYSTETEAYDVQIKDLNKKNKQYADYEELKTKVSTYESEIEKIKNDSKSELLTYKKQTAFDIAMKNANVSNDKLVRKLLSMDELTFDEEKASFSDFSDKLKIVCDEYGISIESDTKTTETKTETKTDKTENIFSSLLKAPDLPTTQSTANPVSKKDEEFSFVESLALQAKERNEKNAQLAGRITPKGNVDFINSFLKGPPQTGKKGK